MRLLAGLLSLVIPGLGQVVRGAWLDAALWFAVAAWVHAMLSGTAWLTGAGVRPLDAALWGALAHPPDRRFPLLVVLTVLSLALHLGAAADVGRPGRTKPPAP